MKNDGLFLRKLAKTKLQHDRSNQPLFHCNVNEDVYAEVPGNIDFISAVYSK